MAVLSALKKAAATSAPVGGGGGAPPPHYLVLAPLSVLHDWVKEVERHSANLRCIMYTGDKDAREVSPHPVATKLAFFLGGSICSKGTSLPIAHCAIFPHTVYRSANWACLPLTWSSVYMPGLQVNQTLNDYYAGAFGPGIPKDPAGQRAIASEGMRYLFKFCTGSLADCIDTINHFRTLAKDKSRLGIPLSFSEETLHGSVFAPQLPMPINLGCTWNASVVQAGFAATAAALTMLGGNIGGVPAFYLSTPFCEMGKSRLCMLGRHYAGTA